MSEQREGARELVLKTASVRAAAAVAPVDCTVLNISRSGARILVPHDAEIPASFALAIDGEDSMRDCEVVWRSGPLIGLSFRDGDAEMVCGEQD